MCVYAAAGSVGSGNFAPGMDKANATIVPLADGKVSFYADSAVSAATSPVQVILDVVGYVQDGSAYTVVSPTRIADSRGWQGLYGPLWPDGPTPVLVAGVGPVPVEATAVVLNVTAIGPSGNGNLRVYPDTLGTRLTPPPNASSINYIAGRDIPNQVVVALPSNGVINLYSDMGLGGAVDVAVDVVGYITAQSAVK